MKKVLVLLATASVLAFVGSAMAQGLDGGQAAPTSSASYAATASHDVVVNLPYVVALDVVGDGSSTTLTFDASNSDIYNAATGNPAPIDPMSGGFQSLKGFTNASTAHLTVTYAADSNNPTTNVLSDVKVNGTALTGFTADVTRNDGYKTIFDRTMVKLNLTGTELPGSYTYTVTYTLTAN